MSAHTRLKLGIALLILGLVMPAGALFVVGTDWSAGVKAVISGTLLFGPELTMVGAVALMGKENFDRIVGKVKGALKALKPAVNVSRQRHAVGLMLFVGSAGLTWITSYVPYLMPEEYILRVAVNLGLDLIFGTSLFVLGGDFWDKLRALFLREARAIVRPVPDATRKVS